jgi:16S rRNA (cytidine1402-2'-O)-methyltransferase
VISRLLEDNFKVIPIPGPSAITAHISVSGILANRFIFLGFFPKKKGEADNFIAKAIHLEIPILFYETSKRIIESLDWLNQNYSIEKISLAKEMTKIHETYLQGTYEEVVAQLSEIKIKGEWSVFIQLSFSEQNKLDINKTIEYLKKLGLNNKQIIDIGKNIYKLSKNDIYKLLIS